MAIGGGTLSLSTVAGEYGGSVPHNISEYYRGGGNVPVSSSTSTIPSSGTIDLQDFQNTSNTLPTDTVFSGTVGSQHYTQGKSLVATAGMGFGGFGSLSDNSITSQDGSTNVTVNWIRWSPQQFGLGVANSAFVSTSAGLNTALGYTAWVASNSASQFSTSSSGSISASANESFTLVGFPSVGHVPAQQIEVGAGSGNYTIIVTDHNTPAQKADNGFTLTITLS